MRGAWRLDPDLEEALWGAAKEVLGERVVKHKMLVPAIVRRSEIYTREREQLEDERFVGDSADLAARALFFTLADAAKMLVPIAELRSRGALPAAKRLRILDFGAGCGAMTFGLLGALKRELDVVAVDRDREALSLFARAAERLGDTRLSLRTASTVPKDSTWDLICCGSVLNELSEPAATSFVRDLVATLSSDGVAILIEPALRETSRRLHRLRDLVIEEKLATVFAPCTRKLAPCPALELERDWCHEDRPFEPTPRLAALTRATGMRAHRLKFSYLVLTRRDLELAPKQSLLRVVSSLKKSKGKSELLACGDEGISKIRLQKRDRTVATRGFSRARRGQLLEVGDARFDLTDPCDED